MGLIREYCACGAMFSESIPETDFLSLELEARRREFLMEHAGEGHGPVGHQAWVHIIARGPQKRGLSFSLDQLGHLRLWMRWNRDKMPAWAQQMLTLSEQEAKRFGRGGRFGEIHRLINRKVRPDLSWRINTDLSNTLAILKASHQRGEPLREVVERLSHADKHLHTKRRAHCRRWLKRLVQQTAAVEALERINR